MKTFLSIVLFLVLLLVAHAQDITQTLKGTILFMTKADK